MKIQLAYQNIQVDISNSSKKNDYEAILILASMFICIQGYVSLQKPISGPFETVLHLEIVTEVRNPVTRRTEVTATSYLMIHIDVGEQSY